MNKAIQILIVILMAIAIKGYSQTDSTTYTKMKEYQKMLNEGLITQEDYDKLKQNLLFPSVDTTKQLPTPKQVMIMSTRKQISQEDYERLESTYHRKVSGGTTQVILGTFLCVISAVTYGLGQRPSITNKKPFYAISGVSGIIGVPLVISGSIKISRHKRKLRNLENDYEVL